MLGTDDLDKYKAALLNLQREVAEQLEAIAPWCEPVSPDKGLGRLTRTEAMQDQQVALHQRKRLQDQKSRIEVALGRVDSGVYGACLACKQPIDPRRLDAAPDAPLCVACLERRGGR